MSKIFHPDVYDRPYYVINNPTMYTREEVSAARYAAFWNPQQYDPPMISKQIIDIAKLEEVKDGDL